MIAAPAEKPINCREANWHPTCIECANGNYEKCLYTQKIAAPQPAPDAQSAIDALHHAVNTAELASSNMRGPGEARAAREALAEAIQAINALAAAPKEPKP